MRIPREGDREIIEENISKNIYKYIINFDEMNA